MGAKKIINYFVDFPDGDCRHSAGFCRQPLYHCHSHHRAHVRRVAWNPVLQGSMDSMVRQNEEIDRLQLPRIADNDQLMELERTQELVPIQESRALRISPSLQADKKYCRPWCNQFLQDMSEAYYKEFRTPLQVNSAVRTMEQQQKLRRHNGNAAPEVGEHASSHLAGITVDLAKRGLTRAQQPGLKNTSRTCVTRVW